MMLDSPCRLPRVLRGPALAALTLLMLSSAYRVRADEPPNPFAPQPEAARPDAEQGVILLSDGTSIPGKIYLTREHRLHVYDASQERFRDVPLRAVARVVTVVDKEWMEKEWRFAENANDRKVFTGRQYPARIYHFRIELKRGDAIEGPLSAAVYIEPSEPPDAKEADDAEPPSPFGPRVEPKRFLLREREKGDPGQKLKDLVYVREIRLGEAAAPR